MANHYKYTGGGFGIRQLCDLVLLLNKNLMKKMEIVYRKNK